MPSAEIPLSLRDAAELLIALCLFACMVFLFARIATGKPKQAAAQATGTNGKLHDEFLMRKLIAAEEVGERNMDENRRMSAELETLRRENAALRTQLADMWRFISEHLATTNAMNIPGGVPAFPESNPALALEDDRLFRFYLVARFSADEIRSIAADCKLETLEGTPKISELAEALVTQARRESKSTWLKATARALRPHAPGWDI